MKFLLPFTILFSYVLVNVEARWKPGPGLTWNYVLGNDIKIETETADVVDIDVNKSPSKIKALHDAGKKVICYFSAGTLEDFRSDFDEFMAVKGLVKNTYEEWPEELWLDVRVEGLKPLIKKRMEVAVSKNCDGIEVDNLDGYQIDEVKKWSNPLTKADTIKYAKWLGTTAHELGISIGLKNVLGIIEEVGPYFDFAINEECIDYNECYLYKNFINSGKAVFGVTYNGLAKNKAALCRNLEGLPISMIIKPGNKLVQSSVIFNGKEHCGPNFNTGLTNSSSSPSKTTTTPVKTTTTIKKTTTVQVKSTTTVKKATTTTPAKSTTTTVKKTTTTPAKSTTTTVKKTTTTPAKSTTTVKKTTTTSAKKTTTTTPAKKSTTTSKKATTTSAKKSTTTTVKKTTTTTAKKSTTTVKKTIVKTTKKTATKKVVTKSVKKVKKVVTKVVTKKK